MNAIHPDSLDLNLLRVFHTVYVERGVGRAAERLRVTPSAVSHGLRRLRLLFDDELFLRAGASMAPTARAQALFEPVRGIMDSIANDVLAAAHFEAGRASREFSLAMTDMAEIVFLPPLLRHLRSSAPGCTLRSRRLANEDMIEALDRGLVEMAIGNVPQAREAHFVQTLFEHDFVVLAAADHPRLERALTWSAYASERHVVVSSGSDSHLQRQALEPRGIRRRIALTVGGFLSVPWLIEATDMLATVPTRLGAEIAGITGLRRWELPDRVPPYALQSVWHARSHADPAHRWLRQAIFALMNASP
jgi:DNA-binding transcriptional LysR family regulator